ncbi:MAG: type II toxin-antitoxin system VapC family toxin [Acidobacteriota bacterium]|nr:type II toxin-antitoxin system VapC family toxin [Acidobacteriota bacterium]
MRPRLIIDASVGVHLALGLESTGKILDILEDTALLMAPGLYFTEVANALWKYVAHEEIERDEAVLLLTDACSLIDQPISHHALTEEALVAATAYHHPVYDMLYAVLARRHGAGVLTFDRRLRRVLKRMGVEIIEI